jgi:hypothetical protein
VVTQYRIILARGPEWTLISGPGLDDSRPLHLNGVRRFN